MNNKQTIVDTLASFKAGIDTINEYQGHTLTLYEIKPSPGTRVTRIRNLKDEIAAALRVPSVRIVAPLPNGLVGIEVPNPERRTIPAAEVLNSPEFIHSTAELPLALGQTVAGRTFVADLATMPHLLVAGATGQGKSVALNMMLLSLLKKKTPEQMRLILIDPKQVELSTYATLHQSYLFEPIITDPSNAQIALANLCKIMDARYTTFNACGVRNIQEYNALAQSGATALPSPCEQSRVPSITVSVQVVSSKDEDTAPSGSPAWSDSVQGSSAALPILPYYVVVIDEYGDLIMQAGREMERLICRLAQKARAVGIHLIVSTQRPSATIVTGNIKANFPTRIALRTTTGTDSRVIIDQTGAERLTGRGDMLLFSGASVTRLQCAYASGDDVSNTCTTLAQQYAPKPQPIDKDPEPEPEPEPKPTNTPTPPPSKARERWWKFLHSNRLGWPILRGLAKLLVFIVVASFFSYLLISSIGIEGLIMIALLIIAVPSILGLFFL